MSKCKNKNISATLATATCALFGGAVPAPVQAQEEAKWDFNTAVLFYGEDDDRVQDMSLSILATRNLDDDRSLTLGLTVDALTGATPNGLIQQAAPQTFTQPSGNNTRTAPANNLVLDETFRDTRVALSANWQMPLGRLYQFNVGGSFSKEFDYLHAGLNARIARDFNKRNTTVSAGIAIAADTIDPEGGTPIPLSQNLDVGDLSNRSGKEDKDVVDLVFGVTQVLSKNLLVQANYSFSNSTGYLTDPFKLLNVVDGISGDAIPRAQTPGVDGPSHEFVYESRPDDRTKHSVYGQAKYFVDGKVLDASYRFMTDDWDIDSHTLDVRLRWPLNDTRYLEPHVRFYRQSAAKFYQSSVVDGAPLPLYASNDYRLGEFDALTVGAKYGWQTKGGNDMSLRLELYQQRGSVPANRLIGNQVGAVSYPDLDAIIVQYSYRFGK